MMSKRNFRAISAVVSAALIWSAAAPMALAQQSRGDYTDVPKLPPGPAGKRIKQVIDTVNSGDPSRVRALVEKAFTAGFRGIAPMEEHLAVFAELLAQSKGYEFIAVRQYKEKTPQGEYVVIVRNKLTEAWEAFVLGIEPEPPHLIEGMQMSPARPPSFLAPAKKLNEAEAIKQLEAFVKRLADADAFSGTVLLAKDGKVLFKAAYGLASKRFDVPNRIDTKFNLGSMNKMFTSVAILQLVQGGKLSLDDPLSKFVSTEWLPREITDKIRIKHLLTHTSGLGSYFNETFMNSSRARFRKLDDYKPLLANDTLAFEPGTSWGYSNTGMFLLGVVIEKVTGEDYFDYVREHIYKPAGMINSDCYDMDIPVPNLAIGYTKEGGDPGEFGGWRNNYYMHVVRGGPAGGGFSTVEDLLAFDQALRSHKLLNAKYTEMVWSAKPDMNSPEYGFGFGIHGTPGNRIVGHGGGFSGINSNLDIFLDSGYTAAVMSNYDRGARPIQDKIRTLLRAMR